MRRSRAASDGAAGVHPPGGRPAGRPPLAAYADPAFVVAPEGRILEVNEAATELTGIAREVLVGSGLSSYFTDPDLTAALFQRALAGDRVAGVLSAVRHSSGAVRDVTCSAGACRGTAGRVTGLLVAMHDVTEARRAERQLAMLGAANHALVRAEQESTLLAEVCEITTAVGGYRLSWVGAAVPEGKAVLPLAQAGPGSGYLEQVHISWDDTPPGQGPTGRAVRTGEPQVAGDIEHDPAMAPWREQAASCGLRSSFAVPFTVGGQQLVFHAYSDRLDAFDDAEVITLQQLADNLAVGLSSLRSQQQRREAEAALRRSQALLTEAQQIAHVGGWEYDPLAGTGSWTDETYRIHGLDPGSVRPTPGMSLSYYHPDDRERLAAAFGRAVSEGEPYDLELRLNSADGTRKWIRTMGRADRRGGQVVRVYGNIIDVTEAVEIRNRLAESEERFRSTMDTMLDPCAVFAAIRDEQGRMVDLYYTYANRAACEYMGIASGDLIGTRLLSLFPGLTGRGLFGLYGHVVETGEPLVLDDYTYEHELFGGAERRYDIRGSRLGDGVSLTWRDITDRYRQQEALRESAGQFRALFEQSPVGVAYVALDGTLVRVNRRFGEITGYGRELEQLTFLEITHPEDLPATREAQRRLRAGEIDSISMEKRYLRKDGSVVWVDMFSTLIRDDQGRPVHLISVVQDIDDRKHAQDEVNRLNSELEGRVRARTAELTASNEQLRVANRELEDFTYTVSHDLRTPLRHMAGFSRILLEDYGHVLDAEGTRLLSVIDGSAQRLGRLIDDLLAFSRIGRHRLARDPVDMTALASGAAAELTAGEPGRDIRIDVGDLPPASGDAALLTQVWTNLLANAIKFTSAREHARISVTGTREPGHAIYHVTDNGIGFSMAYAGKLFGIFQRLHPREDYPGTGVGLAIVARIVARHGGNVIATAQPGEGATFTFTLPVPPDGPP